MAPTGVAVGVGWWPVRPRGLALYLAGQRGVGQQSVGGTADSCRPRVAEGTGGTHGCAHLGLPHGVLHDPGAWVPDAVAGGPWLTINPIRSNCPAFAVLVRQAAPGKSGYASKEGPRRPGFPSSPHPFASTTLRALAEIRHRRQSSPEAPVTFEPADPHGVEDARGIASEVRRGWQGSAR